jgi:ribonuclease P protein component
MQRFKTRAQFQAALTGNIVAKTSHFALHCIDTQPSLTESRMPLFSSGDTWIGAMTPKRWAKRAVTRNAIKRQIYSISDSLQSSLPAVAFLVRLRKEFSRKEYTSASSAELKRTVRAQLLVLMRSDVAHKQPTTTASK